MSETCSLGAFSAEDLREPKHASICLMTDVKCKSDFSQEQWELLTFRTNHVQIENICKNHEMYYLSFYHLKQKWCCDPSDNHKSKPTKGSINITLALCQSLQFSYPVLKPGRKLCSPCYTKMSTLSKKLTMEKIREGSSPLDSDNTLFAHPDPSMSQTVAAGASTSGGTQSSVSSEAQSEPSEGGSSSDSSFHFTPKTSKSEALQQIKSLEKFLSDNNISIRTRQLDTVSYCAEKYNEICVVLKETFEAVCRKEIRTEVDDFNEMMSQLKDKFVNSSSYSVQIAVLSVLPKSWSLSSIMNIFGLKSRHIITTTKKLVNMQGILPVTAKRVGHGLPETTLTAVQNFFDDDGQAIYMLPGKKDCFTIKKDNIKEKVQKRLLLAPLNELYAMFLEKNKDVKISFSAFAQRRPKYCVLAGHPGTCTVCVCSYHQNVQLMVEGAGLKQATKNDSHPIRDTRDLLNLIRCENTKEECIDQKCNDCPGVLQLQELVELVLDIECVDTITYQQWVKKSELKFWTLETVQKERDDFAFSLVSATESLILHDFIAAKQKEHFFQLKSNLLKSGEAVISLDFSENYSFMIQNSIQSFHWSNQQATVHPFIAYYKNEAGELSHDCYVIVSDSLKHESHTVHVFLEKYLQHLKMKVPGLKHVKYWTDGCAAQYKSFKTVANLCHHELDFGLTAEQHYFPTSHGKTANDGVGGTFKRAATLASIRGELIRTPQELYEWARKKWPQDGSQKITVGFVSADEVEAALPMLEARYKRALPVPQIKKMHFIKPLSMYEISSKTFSVSDRSTIIKVRNNRTPPEFENLANGSFVTLACGNTWKLAQVVDKNEESKSLSVKIFEKYGSKGSRWCEKSPATATACNQQDILTIITAPTPKRTWSKQQIFSLNQQELKEVRLQLSIYKEHKEEEYEQEVEEEGL
ncbi:ARL14 effector protein [Frankliniella fusca]|uniref:ARL14 effector protein n=1 Tax=Frankliniella fusca TaxID=407009 RepID=A0AAE1GVA1_9NEOP|nr:ARL14 effector protein [Frankliniella fusca]